MQSQKFFEGLLSGDKDGSNVEKKSGGHLPSATNYNKNAANHCNNNENSKFKIGSSLMPTSPGRETEDSSVPKLQTKRASHSSVSDSNKRPKTIQIEPRDKTFRFDVEILYANDTKHHMQSPSSSWEGNIILNDYTLELMHIHILSDA